MRAFSVTFWKGGELYWESQSDSWERIFRNAVYEINDNGSNPLIAEISRNHPRENSMENGELMNLEVTKNGVLQAFRYFSGRRGLGKSVVSALCTHLLEGHASPLFAVADDNNPSLQLALGLGFKSTGVRILFCEGVRIDPGLSNSGQ